MVAAGREGGAREVYGRIREEGRGKVGSRDGELRDWGREGGSDVRGSDAGCEGGGREGGGVEQVGAGGR